MVSDIRVVANNKFLEKNPAAAKFLSLIELPLGDINAQNTRMEDGESAESNIAKHADEWVANHQAIWDSWLDQARKAALQN